MTDHDRGQVDTSAAEVYDSFFVPALFGRFADAVADTARIGPDDHVIDLACGTGALTRAARARTSGRVVGVDLNAGMLAVAAQHGGDIEYQQGDAQALELEEGDFDLAISQFGLMFFPDPVAALSEMSRVATRGVVAVWDAIERSDYAAMQQLFRDELGDDAASSLDAPFAMGAAGVLEGLCRQAGIAEPTFTSIDGTGRFGSVDEWVTTEVRGWTIGESISDDELAALIETARGPLGRFETADGCVFRMTARLATW